jgi:hypothetical protein
MSKSLPIELATLNDFRYCLALLDKDFYGTFDEVVVFGASNLLAL